MWARFQCINYSFVLMLNRTFVNLCACLSTDTFQTQQTLLTPTSAVMTVSEDADGAFWRASFYLSRTSSNTVAGTRLLSLRPETMETLKTPTVTTTTSSFPPTCAACCPHADAVTQTHTWEGNYMIDLHVSVTTSSKVWNNWITNKYNRSSVNKTFE